MKISRDDIIALPHEHLRQRSKRVGFITPEIRQLILDMEAATLDWEDNREHEISVGLAAVQIDKPLRIFIVRNDYEKKEDRTFTVFINPTITKLEGEITEDFEGCLSVKDIYGKVPRYSRVKVKALDLNGKEFRLTADGFLARLIQHEVDHTNGIVFIDRIKDRPEAFYKLTSDGKLEQLNYEDAIRNNRILW